MDWQSWQVQVGGSEGLVARAGGAVLLAAPTTSTQQSFVQTLLELMGAAAAEPTPGRSLARRTAGLVAQAEPDDVPPLCLLAATDAGVAALLVGAVELRLRGSDGGVETLSGTSSATWVDRLIAEPLPDLVAALGDPAAVPHALSRLQEGVVPGSVVRLATGTAGTTAAPPVAAPMHQEPVHQEPVHQEPAHQEPVAQESGAQPEVEQAPAAQQPAADVTTDLPVAPAAIADAAPVPDAPTAAAVRPAGPVDEATRATLAPPPPVSAFTSISLEPDEPSTPLPTTAEAEPEGVQVKGIMCSRQHFNDPSSIFCSSCGISMVHQTHNLVPGTRPPLGVIVLDDGATYPLVGDYLVGREPEHGKEVAEGRAKPLPLADPDQTMSRAHARIELVGWDVRIVDAGSANGTFIALPGETDWTRIPAEEPRTIPPGTRIAIGGRSLVFDSHHRA